MCNNFINLIGQRFEKLVVLEQVGKSNNGKLLWLCKCDCGNEKIILGNSLTFGRTKSCGCLRDEKTEKRSLKHGHCRNRKPSRIYMIWCGIIRRCNNKNEKTYKYYGGRGIKVCKRWLKFENFLEDVGEIPKNQQIDRIKNNKGYNPKNFRLVTRKENCRNKRNNCLITYNGKTQCLSAWAEELNIKYQTLYRRIYRDKWSIEKAFNY